MLFLVQNSHSKTKTAYWKPPYSVNETGGLLKAKRVNVISSKQREQVDSVTLIINGYTDLFKLLVNEVIYKTLTHSISILFVYYIDGFY